MTEEDKDLLLKDLCARLPYHPRVKVVPDKGDIYDEWWTFATLPEIGQIQYTLYPYLRPMSSMTGAEVLEYIGLKEKIVASDDITYSFETYESIDWLNAHYFDYRGLIEKNLALEAPEGMYNN